MASDAEEGAAQIPPNVMMVSGCMDSQTSADVQNIDSFELPEDAGPGGAGGACTTSLVSVLENQDPPGSWADVLQAMRGILQEKGYSQIPQLSSSRQMSVGQSFCLIDEDSAPRARALLIGINYVGQRGELRGCHNDVEMMRNVLEQKGCGDMRVLLDDGENEPPTRENILSAMDWLVDGAEAGDYRFMHYSGHGGSVRDTSGDEEDRKDETLCPVDYQDAGMILDDEVNQRLVMAMPRDVNLTCLMDCCHSGTILDLPYMLRMDDQTASMIESGEMPMLQENPAFNLEKTLAIGKIAFEEFNAFQAGKQDKFQACLNCLMRSFKVQTERE
eukprot:TRINITY_DN26174_c0_g1_i1.p1 TRINITY_DN26174_c0_g1~~TRINITY_DN26174_c0_g1_i1.p1  ORF type:complete len:331 (-),score=56.07 TRINITY_DN26174_c0_g1_i1:62-1054(-)